MRAGAHGLLPPAPRRAAASGARALTRTRSIHTPDTQTQLGSILINLGTVRRRRGRERVCVCGHKKACGRGPSPI